MTTESVTVNAVRALVRSGMLGPPGPAAVVRLLREVRRGGKSPYTLLAVAAARWPNRAAIIDDDGVLSYRELQSATESLARQLVRQGVEPGQAVGILCRNGRGFVQGVFAAALVGADVVLVNTDFRTDALAAALSSHDIKTMISDSELAERVHAADESAMVVDPATATTGDGGHRPDVAAAGRIVLLTSGTTGKPKGVPRSPHVRSAVGVWVTILDRTRLRTGSRVSVAMPMFHGLGLGMMMLTVGLGDTMLTHRHFDAEAALAQASLHHADAFTAVPVVLARILDLPHAVRARNPVPSLRVVMSSGDRLDPSLGRRFMDTYGDILYNGYGSTEVGIGALATPTDLRDAPKTVGKPVAGLPGPCLRRERQARRSGRHRTRLRRRRAGRRGLHRRRRQGRRRQYDQHRRHGLSRRSRSVIHRRPRGRHDHLRRRERLSPRGGKRTRRTPRRRRQRGHRRSRRAVRPPTGRVRRPGADSNVDETALREYLHDKVSRFEQPRDIRIVSSLPRNPAGKVIRKELPT